MAGDSTDVQATCDTGKDWTADEVPDSSADTTGSCTGEQDGATIRGGRRGRLGDMLC